MQADQKVYDEIMEAVGRRFKTKEPPSISGYFEYPYPQRLFVLREALKEYVLRESGDYKAFINLLPKIRELSQYQGDILEAFQLEMCKWLDDEANRLTAVSKESSALVLSTLLYGERYINKAEKFLFPSWMSNDMRGKICFIHTDIVSKIKIKSLDIVKKLEEKGLKFHYSIFTQEMTELLNKSPDARYWMLGASASLGVMYAKRIHAGFHWVIPDGMYSENYFTNLASLACQYPVILQTSFRTDETVLSLALEKYRNGDVLAVPSQDLVAHSLNSIHLSAWHKMVNNRVKEGGFPSGLVVFWESPNSLHINAPHLDPKYLSPDFVQTMPDRYYMSIDSELDLFIKDDNFYITRECDDLFSNEMSMQEKYAMDATSLPLMDFAKQFWGRVQYRTGALKFFNMGMVIRFNTEIRKSPNAMTHQQIDFEKSLMSNTLTISNPFKQYDLTNAA